MERVLNQIIIPGKKGAFWGAMQGFSNFSKHADKDPDGVHDGIDEQVNDVALFLAALYYADLNKSLTPEMLALMGWHSSLHPDHINKNVDSGFSRLIDTANVGLTSMTRLEQLEFGASLIDIARKSIEENKK